MVFNFSFWQKKIDNVSGSVMYNVLDDSKCKTRHIDLKFNPLQCYDNCVLCTGIPCPFAIVFILDSKLDVNGYLSKKYIAEAGIK